MSSGEREGKVYFIDRLTSAIMFPKLNIMIPRVTSIHVLHYLYHPGAF